MERWTVDSSCTCVAVHESFASKNTSVTADIKQRIGLTFVLSIIETNQLKNALIGPNTESLRSDQNIPMSLFVFTAEIN